nr:serine/threonine-protein kinase [Pseudenhygromyxa sp. WMMC2535]
MALVDLGLAPPLFIDTRYRLLRILGKGGRGLVCLATDEHLHRSVAIKLYPALQPGAVSQEVVLEAQALARLEHQNVVGVYDFGDGALALERADLDPSQAPGQPLLVLCFYMTMQHVHGQSVRRWLGMVKRSREQVLDVFHQAGWGLVHAHEAGVVHRDFKPENVMIDEKGRALVVDFGFARHRSGTQPDAGDGVIARWQDTQIVGTYEYMAPEARLGKNDARSDQYSFALTLHEGLLGCLPPVTSAGVAYVEQHRFPGAVARVLNRALALDPVHRYPSMRELLAELPARWDDQWRWERLDDEAAPSRKGAWLAAGMGAVLFLGGGGLGLALWRGWIGGEAADERDQVEQVASDEVEAPSAVTGCPSSELVGVWSLENEVLWDWDSSRRGVVSEFELEIVARGDCDFVGRMAKLSYRDGARTKRYEAPLRGEAPLHVVRRGALVDVQGTWLLETSSEQDTRRYYFSLEVDDGQARGVYSRLVNGGRPGIRGLVRGAREGRGRPSVATVEALPCRYQCELLCAGEVARKSCETTRCSEHYSRVGECGPPSADFETPMSTQRMLARWRDGEWSPVSGGKGCEAELVAGDWIVDGRLPGGGSRRWTLSLQEADKCRLIGFAKGETARNHSLRVEFDEEGRWLATDPLDPAWAWAVYGWSFAVGEGADGTKLSARRQGY